MTVNDSPLAVRPGPEGRLVYKKLSLPPVAFELMYDTVSVVDHKPLVLLTRMR